MAHVRDLIPTNGSAPNDDFGWQHYMSSYCLFSLFPQSTKILVCENHHFECDEQLLLYLLLLPNIYLKSLAIAESIRAITYFHTFTHALKTTKTGTWNHIFENRHTLTFFFVCNKYYSSRKLGLSIEMFQTLSLAFSFILFFIFYFFFQLLTYLT